MEDVYATAPRHEPGDGEQEHPRAGAIRDESGPSAQPQPERGDRTLVGPGGSSEGEGVSHAAEGIARVLRMVPKTEPQAADEPETSVADLLVVLADRIRAGQINPDSMVVHYMEVAPGDHGHKHQYWRWHLSELEHLGLLQVALVDIMLRENR